MQQPRKRQNRGGVRLQGRQEKASAAWEGNI